MTLKRIVYTSQPFGYDESTLAGLLLSSRRNNERDDVTGALICRRDIYLQWLEGPPAAVDATLARIRQDDRHVDVTLRAEGPVAERVFGAWTMLHDPARSWLWTEAEIDAGALDRASEGEVLAVFDRVAAEV